MTQQFTASEVHERERFEEWYTTHAFNYSRDPIGSRDCSLQWESWKAALTTQERAMDKQFTASEVRRLSNRIPRSNDEIADAQEALRAFADLLEAQERAVPVAYALFTEKGLIRMWSRDGKNIAFVDAHGAPVNPTPLYTHPAPSGAERLAEALRELVVACEEHDAMVSRIIGHPAGWNAQYLNSAREALAAHSAQAQPPAASVPEALRLLQSVLCDTDGNCCIRGTYEDRRTVDKALAMLAAQEKPNG